MSFPGITNYREDVPGTDVVCFLGHYDGNPERWAYSLWTSEEDFLASGRVDIPQPDTYVITPNQVARIAFLLEVDYKDWRVKP